MKGTNIKTFNKPSKQTTKILTAGLAISLFAGSLVFLGTQIEAARHPQPLPANKYCQEAMTAQNKQLQATLNLQFGVTVPEGTPSLDDVKALQAKCVENIDVYQVVAK